uniref:Putative ankyrin repeat-containing domain, PGG domain protein n=1 Tax=Helianthus annuus TaxID=4232 RepID=A0A251V3Y6_HELAN
MHVHMITQLKAFQFSYSRIILLRREVQLASIVEDKLLSHPQPQSQPQLPPPQQQEINNRRLKPNLPRRYLIAGPRENYLKVGVPLYEAAIKCNWNAAKAILEKKKELVRFSITENGETALHVAASSKGDPKNVEEFVRNLVDLMEKEDLALENESFNTALYLAAAAGNIKTVKIMVEKNNILQTIPGSGQMLPLYVAALFGHYDVVKYLYEVSNELRDDCWNPENRGWLLEKCVENDMFDIALEIVKKYPDLVRGAILGILARKPKAFDETNSNIITRTIKTVFTFIGSKVGAQEKENQALLLLRIIWEDVAKKPKKEIDTILRGPVDSIKQDKLASGRMVLAIQLQKLISELLGKMEVETQKIIRGQHDSTTQDTNPTSAKVDHALQLKNLISDYVVNMHIESQKIVKQDNTVVVGKGDQALVLTKLISKHIVNVHDETQDIIKRGYGKEDQAQHLQKLISKSVATMRAETNLRAHSTRVLFIAAEMGNTTFLVELIRKYPDLIWKVNDNNLSIFHIAVKHRHEGIYNLLYEIGAMKDLITPLKDEHENNMLHLVGTRAKQKQLEDVSGVALQMQRELLWFQEVEKMIPPSYRERKNRDGLTPHELFTMEHKELVIQGEKWMKDTASQCMVVAALIATIVFAAAFTVPGGYDQNNGIPIFHSKATFMVFVVADAISLVASSASILIFLSILTSRYAESDFLESLPEKLILGILTLFLSITTMTVAFGVSFFVLYHKGLLWMPILICVFGVLPVLLYISLQYGLFFDVIRSTYRSRYLFKPKKHVLYYENPKV